jgi:hypothetical protein
MSERAVLVTFATGYVGGFFTRRFTPRLLNTCALQPFDQKTSAGV